jgi:hypothetical protein
MLTCKKKTLKKLRKPCCPCPHCLNEKTLMKMNKIATKNFKERPPIPTPKNIELKNKIIIIKERKGSINSFTKI